MGVPLRSAKKRENSVEVGREVHGFKFIRKAWVTKDRRRLGRKPDHNEKKDFQGGTRDSGKTWGRFIHGTTAKN